MTANQNGRLVLLAEILHVRREIMPAVGAVHEVEFLRQAQDIHHMKLERQ